MRRRSVKGFTLVELLIGTAISLMVVLGATAMLGRSLDENRKLLVEARVMQDLRTSLDLMARSARRAGYWRSVDTDGLRTDTGAVSTNPNTEFSPEVEASNSLSIRYSPQEASPGSSGEAFGFRLRSGAIEALIGEGHWQALTDSQTVLITRLSIRPTARNSELEVACSTSSGSVAPRTIVRSLDIELTGRATADASVARTLQSTIRLRNDIVSSGCAT